MSLRGIWLRRIAELMADPVCAKRLGEAGGGGWRRRLRGRRLRADGGVVRALLTVAYYFNCTRLTITHLHWLWLCFVGDGWSRA
jgi:hypothetical protein